jgi:hypothetical protein
MRHPISLGLTVVLSILAGACGSEESTAGSALVVERDRTGDTLVVRTVSGSAWGDEAYLRPEMSIGELDGDLEYLLGSVVSLGVGADGTVYLVDRQVPELRAYDATGTYIGTFAGPGEGPGEIKGPDGGLAVLSDGRILVRDPGNARLQEFLPDGTPGASWTVVRGGFHTSSPLWMDRQDNVYINVLLDPQADVRDWRTGLARVRPDGTPADTLEPPDAGFEAPTIEARVENGDNVSVSRNGVPFSPEEEWAFHPGGYFVHGISTEYALTLNRPEGPLRIERAYEPVAVKSAEKESRAWSITRNFRQMKPGWRWNGPPIPDEKPPFSSFLVARDGRVWVVVSQEGFEEENPNYDPREEGSRPTRWSEPTAFDVFGEDGTYFGRVHAPDGMSAYPTPVIDGDYMWAVTRDELGVQRVVRFKVEMGQAETQD